jgi:hypothetical protein
MIGDHGASNFTVFVVSLIAAMLIGAGISHSQLSNATLVGSVQDPGGAVLPGTTVTVRNQGTNQIRTDVTSAEGLFRIADLPPGDYEIKAEKQGFKITVASKVVLHSGRYECSRDSTASAEHRRDSTIRTP